MPHAGFGVGFERLVMLATGVQNIRDVIPFPRYPGESLISFTYIKYMDAVYS